MSEPILIQDSMTGPKGCPSCGSTVLYVATDGKGSPPNKQNPRGHPVRFIGYDCKECGQKLRFSIAI